MSVGLVLAGRYRLTRKLGEGGMGSVWVAEDLNLGAEVAVKLIDAAFTDSSEAIMRFRREAKAAATIRSTYVVQVFDHGVDNGVPFIAMELLKGESLAQRLTSVQKLSPGQTGKILSHVGRALALAHDHGIVHRDMKPENIFLVREGEEDVGKVLDFGIARQAGGLAESGGVKTRTGAVLGTPYYMSPEQATGQNVDHLTDIWSFGVIASECLTGRRSFDGESLGGLFHAICMAPLPIPSQLGEVPSGFDEWFARAVARDRPSRFQSIKEASDTLRNLCGRSTNRPLSGASIEGDPGPRTSRHVAPMSPPESPQLAGEAGLQTTAMPSARSIADLLRPQRGNRMTVAWVGVAVVAASLFAGWRLMNKSAPTATGVSAPDETTPKALLSASAATTFVAGAPSTQASVGVNNLDAGVSPPAKQPLASTPQPQTATRQHAAHPGPVAPSRQTLPNATLPLASTKPPAAVPQKRDDNAAGI